MTEQPQAPADETPQGPTPPTTPTPDLSAELDKWKAMSRKNEQAAKASAAQVDQLTAQLAERDQQLASLTAERDTATAAALRLEVGMGKGLTAAQQKFLTGSSRDELEAAADELLAAFPAVEPGSKAPPPTPAQPDPGGPQEAFGAFMGPALN